MNRMMIYCAVLVGVILGSVAYSASASRAEKSFLTEAAQSGAGEVAMANTAIERAQNPGVKSFAQQLAADHAKVIEDIKALAAQKGVTLPGMSVDHHIMVSEFVELREKEFDSKFVKRMVANHEKSVALYRKASTSDADADVRAFAAKTLPTLESHLAMARTLRKQN